MDPSFIGRTVVGGPFEVGRDAVRAFATAIGEDDPRCHDVAAARAAGQPDLLAPPTFAFALTMRVTGPLMADPALGLQYDRAVHGEQTFAYRRPLVAGDEVHVSCTVQDIAVRGSNEVLTAQCTLTGADGLEILRTTEVFVTRGTA
jgi:acyl dehydratase